MSLPERPEALPSRRGRNAPAHPESNATAECRGAWRSFARGALEMLWITTAFVALGLGYAEVVKRATSEPPMYAAGFVTARTPEGPSVWLVDGFNVIQRALLGGREREEWWTARAPRGGRSGTGARVRAFALRAAAPRAKRNTPAARYFRSPLRVKAPAPRA